MARRRKCSRCQRNRAERFFTGPRGRICADCKRTRVRYANRSIRLAEQYGISAQEYRALLEAQGGVCAICGGRRSYNLDVDHDHALEHEGRPIRETVRGLLCRQCNRRILRSCRDNTAILRAAIAYLESPPARQVLDSGG